MIFGLHSALEPMGPQAGRIAHLWWVMFWTSAAVFVLVVGFMLRALIRPQASRARADVHAAERRARAMVGGAAVATVVVLVSLLVASVATGRALATSTSPPLEVDVVGHQWWWEVRYPGSMPSLDVTTANEVHLPVGRPVLVQLSAHDVVHSFWIPSLHGKRDLIPGRDTALTLQADRPGEYRGLCAEFCGLQHAHMGFSVVAESEDAFQAWLAAQRQTPARPADALQARGQEVFLAVPCAMCHTVMGTPARGRNGPDLTHVASRPELAAGTLPNTPENMAAWITDPHRSKPGTKMPPTELPPADLKALVAWLGSLK